MPQSTLKNPDYSLRVWTKIRETLKHTGDPLSKWTELGVQLKQSHDSDEHSFTDSGNGPALSYFHSKEATQPSYNKTCIVRLLFRSPISEGKRL
jgi:hypothetical protein